MTFSMGTGAVATIPEFERAFGARRLYRASAILPWSGDGSSVGSRRRSPSRKRGKRPGWKLPAAALPRWRPLQGGLGVALGSHWGGFDVDLGGFVCSFCILHSSFCLRPSVALPGLSRFKVRCSKFGLQHQQPEYNSPSAPPSGWSGGTLDKPWTSPSTVDPAQAPIFDQPHLSRSLHPPLRRLRSSLYRQSTGLFSPPRPCRSTCVQIVVVKGTHSWLSFRGLQQRGKAAAEVKSALTQRRRERGGTQRRRAFSFSFLCVPPRSLRLCVRSFATGEQIGM
jgi:hypothetical protein